MKTTRELQDLVNQIGKLQMQARLLKKQIKEGKDLLKQYCEEHGTKYINEEECNGCKGTGKNDEDKVCHLCDGDGVRYFITIPTEPDDDFVCRIFDVSQLVANQKKAKKLLKHQTFNAIFTPCVYIRVDINPTKEATAKIGE